MQSFLEFLYVSLYGCFAGFDVGRKTEQFHIIAFAAPGLADRVLSDVESQKVKAGFLFPSFQGVGNPRFARFRFQSHLLEPLCGEPLTFLDYRPVFMEYDKIIGVPDHSRFHFRERSAVID